MKRVLIGLIRLYQKLFSAHRQVSVCRFSPSCSCYGVEALEKHGAIYGTYLTVRRVLRCNPWGGSGYDPVPEHNPLKKRIPKPQANNKRED